MRNRSGRIGRAGRSGREDRTGRRREEIDFDDEAIDDVDEDAEDDESAPRRSRRAAPSASRRDEPARRSRGGSRFGFGRGRGRQGGLDWDALEDDDGDYADLDTLSGRRASSGRGGRRQAPSRVNLFDLCIPVFGCAAVLPTEPEHAQPQYPPLRDQVIRALQRIESEAQQHGIEAEDAKLAVYALCFLMDELVARSMWTGKSQWATEPLGIVLQQDPEGGVNFFRRLDVLGDRQNSVRAVYLVCLALGYRGKWGELEERQQDQKIAEIRQELIRRIHPVEMERMRKLFPEAYREADEMGVEVPPPKTWWWAASIATIAAALLLYALLFWQAGKSADATLEKLTATITMTRATS